MPRRKSDGYTPSMGRSAIQAVANAVRGVVRRALSATLLRQESEDFLVDYKLMTISYSSTTFPPTILLLVIRVRSSELSR